MTLSEIIRQSAAYAGNVRIEVDTRMPWVSIGEDIFLQGDEAFTFVNEANRLWEEVGDVGMDDVYGFLACPYLDSLE